jgi:hypothetical protein
MEAPGLLHERMPQSGNEAQAAREDSMEASSASAMHVHA